MFATLKPLFEYRWFGKAAVLVYLVIEGHRKSVKLNTNSNRGIHGHKFSSRSAYGIFKLSPAPVRESKKLAQQCTKAIIQKQMCQIQIKFVGLFLADLWRAQVLIANHLRCSNNKIFLSLSFYLFNKRELSGVQRSSYSYWAAAVNQFDFQFTTFRINHLSTIPQTKFKIFSKQI